MRSRKIPVCKVPTPARRCQSTAKYYSPMQRHGNFKVRTVDAMDTQTPKENFSDYEEIHSWENTYGIGIINATEEPHELTTQPQYVHTIESTNEWSATVQMNNSPITFKLDTGASANLMTSKDLATIPGTHEMIPAACKLTDYNGNQITSRGSCRLQVVNNKVTKGLRFEIVDDKRTSLLGAQAGKDLRMI
ncbi:hypothetical protein scyTo_0013877 [Scyliorhinus torazame]|uniref:Peptidase A2 domain-containing protein n=1 Tax=Scyliorhinus torazame TaxID=75743 RepID=A0A401P6N9_SCYTO|nr:hypothetical protein [Scyliorhinus torazame]